MSSYLDTNENENVMIGWPAGGVISWRDPDSNKGTGDLSI